MTMKHFTSIFPHVTLKINIWFHTQHPRWEQEWVLALLLGHRFQSTWKEACWWKLWECEIVQASSCYLHSLRTDFTFYHMRESFPLGGAEQAVRIACRCAQHITSIKKPLMCSDPSWMSYKKNMFPCNAFQGGNNSFAHGTLHLRKYPFA